MPSVAADAVSSAPHLAKEGAAATIGSVIDGRYRVDALLGRGSMGSVYRAYHLQREAPVALKVLLGNPGEATAGALERFHREAVAASRVHTDHVVRILDSGDTAESGPFFVMELLEGEDLEALLTRGPLDVPRAVHIALQALRGLDVAHAAGVIHRDLKPGNLFLLERDGEGEQVKILDFGISKVEGLAGDLKLTIADTGMGTPFYVAPEQAQDASSVGTATDLYALAAILHECLSGAPPLDAGHLPELLRKIVHETPIRLDVLRAEVPVGLADAVALGLAKDVARRPASAEAFAHLLAPFADERSRGVLRALHAPVAAPSSFPASTLPEGLPSVVPVSNRKRRASPPSTTTAPAPRSLPAPARSDGTTRDATLPGLAWAAVAILAFVMTFAVGLSLRLPWGR